MTTLLRFLQALGATFLLGAGISASAAAEAIPSSGIGVNVTRIVIKADSMPSGNIVVSNNSRLNYLVKNRVLDFFTREPIDTAIATPPVMLMPVGRQSRVTVSVLSPDRLPTDRESLFLLESTAIPGTSKNGERQGNSIRLDFASVLKVYYRPRGISANMDDAIHDITWKREGKELVVTNPSPLHVTFAVIRVNDKNEAAGLVLKPFESHRIPVENSDELNLEWRCVNDLGAVLREIRKF